MERRIVGIPYRRVREERREWSLVTEDLEVAGMCTTKEYIQRRQAAIAENIENHPTYEIFMGAERILGSSRSMQWWHQYLIHGVGGGATATARDQRGR